MPSPVICLGSGGHARVVIEILQAMPEYEVVAVLDPRADRWHTTFFGIPIVGGDDELFSERWQDVRHFMVCIGSVASTARRREAFERARHSGRTPATAVHRAAVVSASATLGAGTVVMAGGILNPGASVGDNVIINTGAIIDHDSVIGDHAHVATGARISGGVHVGAGAHIGTGATIRQCTSVGDGAVVGAGAVVVKDVPPDVTVVGVPARVLRRA